MLQQNFYSFATRHKLFSKSDSILLAVSGGIDSMVMLDLFYHANINCAIAHCNFQLRGSESDDDEAFVKEKAGQYEFMLHTIRFDTKNYAQENKLSIQMAARELRYTWFDSLVRDHGYDWIAVAHNHDDNLETFFINLGRGTGIDGLTGIAVKSEKIIRPMLFASRRDIELYAQEHQLPHREDSSNKSDKYLRNFIRHQILPRLEEVFPRFRQTLGENMNRLADTAAIYHFAMDQFRVPVVSEKENNVLIHIGTLLESPAPQSLFYEILSQYNFSAPAIAEIFQSCEAPPGRQFFSPTHKIVKDRDHFIVHKLLHQHQGKYYIEEQSENISQPIRLSFASFERTADFEINKNPAIAQLDYDKLIFPLILRKWAPGDYFTPLGMKGFKKLSDFFIDRKLSLIDKENTWILVSGSDIVWITGQRIDDRYKITGATRKIYQVNLD